MSDPLLIKKCNELYDNSSEAGKHKLLTSLMAQEILQNIGDIEGAAKDIRKYIDVKAYASGEVVYAQGDLATTQLYFILHGQCAGYKNNNLVAVINAGECFGEFPLLDPSTAYTITARAHTDSCFGSIAAREFETIAEKYPKIWQNLAKMVAKRLRLQNENTFKNPRREVHRLFVGSSSKALEIAYAIKELLISKNLEVEVWDESTFLLGKATLEQLESALEKFDFGVFIFNDDDRGESKGKEQNITRDNVIFELGLFMGKLKRTRAYLLKPKNLDVKILTDFDGITVAEYIKDKGPLKKALKPAADIILKSIERETSLNN